MISEADYIAPPPRTVYCSECGTAIFEGEEVFESLWRDPLCSRCYAVKEEQPEEE